MTIATLTAVREATAAAGITVSFVPPPVTMFTFGDGGD